MYQFLFLSNLLEEKGVLVVLDACQCLKNQGQSFICHFVGGESSELTLTDMQAEVKAREIQDVVLLHGPLYEKNKEEILQLADALVFPTFYHNECFPMVILEAMKYALPVISTHIAAISDIVESGKTGILIPPRKVSPLVDAMASFLNNPKQSAEMGKNGQTRFLNNFTFQHFENTLSEILKEA